MKDKNRDKLQREYDVNQDFVVAILAGIALEYCCLMVVTTRAPRQWAECLAETYIKNRLSISKLKSHSEISRNGTQHPVKSGTKWSKTTISCNVSTCPSGG